MTKQVCVKCVMDTTDPQITFDEHGVCNHCHNFENVTAKGWFPNQAGKEKLEVMLARIKKNGVGKDYDCVIGLSGGVDSSFLVLKAKEWGLRPLIVHVDAGWNSELAVANIEKVINYCSFDLHTEVINWDDMKNIQLAYFKSGVANQDVAQDHIFFSTLYRFAVKNNIDTVLNGGNIATESVFPQSWHHSAMDAINLKAIVKKFGRNKLYDYKTVSFFQYYFSYPFIHKMKVLRPLNFLDFNKDSAIAYLEKIGWRSYGKKHGESIFTKFFQNHYLPVKHQMDKRIPHLSSLIVSGQITRDEALIELKKPLYLDSELSQDIEYFCKKLGITKDEYNKIMNDDTHHYTDFPNWDSRYKLMKSFKSVLEKVLKINLDKYS